TPPLYTYSLHYALPIYKTNTRFSVLGSRFSVLGSRFLNRELLNLEPRNCLSRKRPILPQRSAGSAADGRGALDGLRRRESRETRSEEHTSELQSRVDLV